MWRLEPPPGWWRRPGSACPPWTRCRSPWRWRDRCCRGATHSLLAVAGCAWLLLHDGYSRAFVAPVLVGYLSHLAGDLLTPRGLRLAWPLKGTWALPLCRSGSPFEPVVVAMVLVWAWCSAVTPQTRQAILSATRVCEWMPPDFFAALCPPPPRQLHAKPRRPSTVVAATRSGPRG